MLSLLIPVLPFGFFATINGAQTDLLAGAALAAFAVALVSARGDGHVLLASASYGGTIALVTLIHEASPLLYSLGAVIAIVVLSAHSPMKVQRLGVVLAVVPGLVVAPAVALFGRRGISSQLCAFVPHRAVNWPAAGHLSTDQIMSGQRFFVDYHDWVCRNVIEKMDQTPIDAAKYAVSFGVLALIGSTLLGIVIFASTILAIRYVSEVPFARFRQVLHGRLVWVIVAAAIMLPLFATTTDWTRWWVRITFEVGIVYLLYASSQAESASPPTRRTYVIFAVSLVLFALVPIGNIANVGMTVPV